MRAGSPVAVEGELLAGAAAPQRGRGLDAAHLRAIDRDGELGVAFPGILVDGEIELAAAREAEALGAGPELRDRRGEHGGTVIGGAVVIEVAVGRRRAAPGVVEEIDRDLMRAGAPAAGDVELLALSQGMRGRDRLGAADLLAVDRDGELRVALPGILRHLHDQGVGTAAELRRRRRHRNHRDRAARDLDDQRILGQAERDAAGLGEGLDRVA